VLYRIKIPLRKIIVVFIRKSYDYFFIKLINRNIAINIKNVMGITKVEKFTAEQNQIASFAKVLGHPARIAILQQLIKMNACVCGDLVDEIGLAQSTISQHLKELKKVGLIQGTIEGTSVCYCINTENWKLIEMALNKLFSKLEINNNCC
jgi:ArsR family transcriptional regulator